MKTLNHQVLGAGPAILLLHAGVADMRMWDAQMAELSRGRMVVRCDLRGFGGSTLTPGASYSDAEDVLALLEELGIEAFSVVAASYGAYVALQIASAAPHRVERLVLLSPLAEVVDPDDSLRTFWAEEERLVDAGDLDSATELNVRTWLGPDADGSTRELVRRMQRDALVQQVAAGEVENRELEVALERLTMPIGIFAGGDDQTFFVETARELARQLPDAHLVELPWAGHLPSLERPAETTRLILDSLSGR
ncbi:MAG: alpha/beta fold hydrolase [Nocardioidaceae bacterium]